MKSSNKRVILRMEEMNMWMGSKMEVTKEFNDYLTKEIVPVGTILIGNGYSGNEYATGNSFGKQISASWDDVESCMKFSH